MVGDPLPPAFLKHADEHTVAGMAAVCQALHDHGLPGVCGAGPSPYHDWGVLAAPRFLGRTAMAVALQRFIAEGAWGVSPHLIPHRSLHAVSGSVSQALKIHGPNFGVGGGPGCTTEALLTAAAMLHCQRLPGVWVVLTGLEPEALLDADGRPGPDTAYVGVALALAAPRPGWQGLRLRVVGGANHSRPGPAPNFDLMHLGKLLGLFRSGAHTLPAAGRKGPARGDTTVVQLLDGGCRLELSRPGFAPVVPEPPQARSPAVRPVARMVDCFPGAEAER